MSAVIAKSRTSLFEDDELRLGFVLSQLERRKPDGLGYAYTSIYRHNRIEVTIHKVVPYDEQKAQKRLAVFAVVDAPEGLRKVHPDYADVYVKERPVARVVLDPQARALPA